MTLFSEDRLQHTELRELSDEEVWYAKRLGYLSPALYAAEIGRRERKRRLDALSSAPSTPMRSGSATTSRQARENRAESSQRAAAVTPGERRESSEVVA